MEQAVNKIRRSENAQMRELGFKTRKALRKWQKRQRLQRREQLATKQSA